MKDIFFIFIGMIFGLNLFTQTNYYVNDAVIGEGSAICSVVGNDSNNGTSTSTPKATLQDIFDTYDLEIGDTVFIDVGNYSESFINVGSNDDGFVLKGVSETLTIFDGGGVMYFMSIGNVGNDNIKIQDFTIRNYGSSTTNRSGNGIQIGGGISDKALTGLVIYNMTFDDIDCRNTNSSYGGAIAITNYASGSDITIDSCLFINNDGGAAGAISNHASSSDVITLTITNSTFHTNSSAYRCAIYREASPINTTMSVKNCKFYNNTSARTLIFMYGTGTHTFTNCLFYENTVTDVTEKGIFEPYQTTLNLRNCTVVDNDGGGIYVPHTGSTINIYSCIIQDNTSQNDIHEAADGAINMYHTIYNTISGDLETNINNETVDATFTNSVNDDYSLAPGSNGIDEGYNIDTPVLDILGATRDDGLNDKGCYEFGATILPVELVSFKGKPISHDRNLITWVTASEINNDYFKIQVLTPDNNLNTIGYIQGNGNSTTFNKYKYYHRLVNSPITIYYIEQVDFDGTIEVFGPLVIENTYNEDRILLKKINNLGQEVSNEYRGIIYEIYNDGYIRKIYNS
jgi:hypothetical protein